MTAKDFDELLERFGNHHTYQKWIIALVICPTSALVALYMNLFLFQMAIPEHWCHVPGRENTQLTESQWKNLTIPVIDGEYSSCLQYKINWSADEGDTGGPQVLNITQGCKDGWDHSKVEFTNTWATDLGWLCDREDNSKMIYSAFHVGSAIGTVTLTSIADKYTGRRLMFYITMAIAIAFSLPLTWISNFTVHVILRFLSGFTYETNYQMPYVIGLELVSPELRASASMFSFMSWTFGMCAASLIAWLIPRWDYLNLIACIPPAICFLYWWYIPESPRWLLAHGRISECADVILKIAKVNKRPLPNRSDLEFELELLRKREKETLSMTQVFRYPHLRLNTIILFILFFNCFLAYGMVLLSMNILSSNFFLSHFVLSIFELPSNFIGLAMTHFLGRKFTLFSTVFLTGAFSVLACFCLHDKWALLAMLGFIKLFATIFIFINFLLATEIFPTPVRAAGFGGVFTSGVVAVVVSPYAVTNAYGEYFPYLLIAASMAVSLIAGWPLPETIGLPLPQTFHDSETLGEGRPLTTWIHHWNKSKYPKYAGDENEKEQMNRVMETGN